MPNRQQRRASARKRPSSAWVDWADVEIVFLPPEVECPICGLSTGHRSTLAKLGKSKKGESPPVDAGGPQRSDHWRGLERMPNPVAAEVSNDQGT